MSILAAVEAELDALNVGGWHREVAVTLAAQLDDEPNASMARELRSLMAEVGSRGVGRKRVNALDELRAKREARGAGSKRAASGTSST